MPVNRKMTVGFDATALTLSTKSGVGYYALGLLEALAGNFPEDLEIVAHYFDFLGRVDLSSLPKAPNIRYVRTVWAPRQVFYMLRRLGLPIPYELFLKKRVDFHFFPNFLGWPSVFRTPSAPTIHDLYYLEHPEQVSRLNQYDLQKLVPKTLRRSSFVVAISRSTANAVRSAYPDIQKPVVVSHIPPTGLPAIPANERKQLIKDLGIKGKFILFLGNIEPRKNLTGLLAAYESLPEGLRDSYNLVVAGGKGWKDEAILSKFAELKAKGLSIVRTGYVSEAQKAALYQEATAFVLPSLYEGFGIPLLEAMSCGLPVLASDIPVFREVAGDGALFCDPTNSGNIAAQLETLLRDSNLQHRLTAAGSLRLKGFSWHKTADVIYQAMGERRYKHEDRD